MATLPTQATGGLGNSLSSVPAYMRTGGPDTPTATTSATTGTGGGFDMSSFLQNGQIPEGSALTASTRETSMPAWYMNYAQQLIANQNAIMQQPYQTYQGPRVAEVNPTQQQGFDATKTAAGAYQPGLATGTATTNAAANAPGAATAAQPWLNRSGETSVANIGQYMNPYTDAVVSRIGELGARNLSENLMPAIESKYINAGQLGFGPRGGGGTPSGMMTDTARAVRDTNADILAQQSAALQQGYTQAANLSQGDLSRYGQLGATAGQLANTEQQTQLQAGQQQAELAGLEQKYGLEGAGAVTAVGNQQQQNTQQNLDVAYGDFLRQQGWNQEQINAALNTLKGVQGAVPTAQTEQGIVPSGQQAQYAPSTASSIAGVGLGLLSGLKDLGILKP